MSRWPLFCALLPILAGCALPPVQPWQREHLAAPEMQWEAGLAQESAIRAHTYSSKEAAAPGPVLGGGGCGCN